MRTAGWPRQRFPVVDMMEVSERTRRGWRRGQGLGDHAAHRGADHVGAVEAEGVEQARGVVGHVVQGVGRAADPAAQELGGARRRHVLEVRRAPDVAVVEADDEEAATGQLGTEVLVPGEHLRAQPHDQEQRRVAAVAEGVVAEADVADVGELLVHDARSYRP